MFKCIDNGNFIYSRKESVQLAFFVMNDARQLMKEIVEKINFLALRELLQSHLGFEFLILV